MGIFILILGPIQVTAIQYIRLYLDLIQYPFNNTEVLIAARVDHDLARHTYFVPRFLSVEKTCRPEMYQSSIHKGHQEFHGRRKRYR